MNRRRFLGAVTAGSLLRPAWAADTPFPVQFRKPNPYEPLLRHIKPGHDEFPGEKQAFEIAARWNGLQQTRSLPLAPDFHGISPLPVQYRIVAPGVSKAQFNPSDLRFQQGLERWLDSLGKIRRARFFVLPRDLVRYEISSDQGYRVGIWKQTWSNDRLTSFEPLEEILTNAPRPLFRDITEHSFGGTESFRQQMLKGVPYWRARLDSATGIDVYGNNGIAAADIDNDGWDEIYVCQPGGLPNRLYKNRGDGSMEDITERAGLGVLDDTSSALFVDFRNTGLQDLVVLRAGGPLLFLNEGNGRFRHKPDAFQFIGPPQGTFTGMAAADYDRDGKVDLYLCSYIYFQSEDQYRYPVPYHDAQNGPPNFLFQNRLDARGVGIFEDVTHMVGLNQNNNRYSFAAAWCDYDGDGWPDLYVANDFGRNNLYKNDRGRFRDVAADAGVEDIGPGMSAAWFDYDGDGRPDLYVSNMWTEAGQRVTQEKPFRPSEAYHRHTKGNSLYRNRGDGTFEETSAAQGVEMGRWAWSSDGIDFDNDRTPEIFITSGMLTNSSEEDLNSFFWRQVVARSPAEEKRAPDYENGWNALNQLIREDDSWNGREPNVLYVRRGGRYYDFSGVSGLDYAEDSRAFAVTDLDGDGNLDVVLKNRLGPQVRAFRNDCGTERRSLAIRLHGAKSNQDAIGARVEVDGQVKFVQAGSGFLSQHTKQLYFGLDTADRATHIRVTWPSGQIHEFHQLAAGFRYDIVEGSAEVKRTAFRTRTPIVSGVVHGDNEPRTAPTWLLEPIPLPQKLQGPGFLCLTAGERISPPAGVTCQIVDLKQEPADVATYYALFRRYLFDWRTDLRLPFWMLIDERALVHRVYPSAPDARDPTAMRDPNRDKLALPFSGRYYTRPHRNYFRLGSAFFWAGYPEQAVLYLEQVLRQSPDNFKALLAIGQIHLEAGRAKVARRYLEQALSINPQSPEAWNNLGGVEMSGENYRAALVNYEKALALEPNLPFVLVNAGQAYVKLGDSAMAEKMFRRALQADSSDADAANQLGLVLAKQDRADEARKWFQYAIAKKKDHASAINNLGVLYLQLGQTNDAVAAFQYGIEVAPEDDTLYLNLGRVYVSRGEREKAREVMRRLLARKPTSIAASKALAELGNP